MESRLGSYVCSVLAAVVGPLDALADVADENCVAGSDFLPPERALASVVNNFDLEVPNNEGQRGNSRSRAVFRRADSDELCR